MQNPISDAQLFTGVWAAGAPQNEAGGSGGGSPRGGGPSGTSKTVRPIPAPPRSGFGSWITWEIDVVPGGPTPVSARPNPCADCYKGCLDIDLFKHCKVLRTNHFRHKTIDEPQQGSRTNGNRRLTYIYHHRPVRGQSRWVAHKLSTPKVPHNYIPPTSIDPSLGGGRI